MTRLAAALALPDLPPGWTWHVYGRYGNLSVELIDATSVGKMMLAKQHPYEFKPDSTPYARLLARGVHVESASASSARKLLRLARRMADRAWLVESTRERLAAEYEDDEGREPIETASLIGGRSA